MRDCCTSGIRSGLGEGRRRASYLQNRTGGCVSGWLGSWGRHDVWAGRASTAGRSATTRQTRRGLWALWPYWRTCRSRCRSSLPTSCAHSAADERGAGAGRGAVRRLSDRGACPAALPQVRLAPDCSMGVHMMPAPVPTLLASRPQRYSASSQTHNRRGQMTGWCGGAAAGWERLQQACQSIMHFKAQLHRSRPTWMMRAG